MSRYVVHEGTPCPDCCGTGYTATGICETCGEAGVIGREVAHVPDGWLYLPTLVCWLNPDSIESIDGYHADNDKATIRMYEITRARHASEPVIEVGHPDDVAAVTAWLRGRM